MKISYTKYNGEWALRIEGDNAERGTLVAGAQVIVKKRDGSTKTEILGQAVDIQRDFVIALIAGQQTRSQWHRGGDGVERKGDLRRNPKTGRIWRER